jgi:hypothetical protein
MLRGTLSKAMWVGRGAAAVFGLALVLALVLGAATMALAAVPGDPFRLGQTNGIDRLSTLVGNVATPMLRVDNGSTREGATALDLRVEAGKPPMKVNSSTKVALLNADEVDGLSSEELRGQQGPPGPQGEQGPPGEQGEQGPPGEPRYTRTVVVSPQDGATPTENGDALLDALDGITGATAENPRLLLIEPGTYDLGNGSLSMKPFVDVEGSGELNTVITSSATLGSCFPHPGTVNGASNAEIRFLTVRNTGAGPCSSAISNNSASPRLTHLAAEVTGGGSHHAVFNASNSSPTMTDVTATASGGTFSYGVFNSGSSPTMTDVTATASGGSSANYGVWDQTGSSPTIKQSKLSGTSNSLWHDPAFGGGTAKVALSQLVEPVGGSSFQCFNNYNENMAAVTCP